MINWQLSKQGIRWPLSLDRTARSSVDPSRSSIFWSYPLTNYQFQMIAGSSLFFPMIHMKYVVFMSLWPRTIKILISNWPPMREFSPLFKNIGEKNFSFHVHALVMLYVQFLCSDWSKFDKWVHAENLCSTLKHVFFDSWSWQSFVSTCDIINCLFPLGVQNEIQLLSRVLCYSWLVLLIGFLLEKCVACQSRKSDFVRQRSRFSHCLMRKRVKKC